MSNVTPDFSEVAPSHTTETPKQMLTVSESEGLTTVRINSSSLGIILSCPRKAYYSLHRNFRARSESPALTFGTAIHKALEVFYSHPRAERTIPLKFKELSDLLAFDDTDAPVSEHFLFTAIRAFVKAAQPLRALPASDKRSIPNGIWTLQQYFITYINDPYVVYADEAGPVTERTAETLLFDSPTLRIILFGTLDVVLRHEQNGNVLPADHKTSSIIGSDFFNRLKPNHQYTGYLVLAQRALGLTTNEFLVNCLQVKPKPVTARGKDSHFTRQVTTRSEQDIQEFVESVTWAVRSYLEWMRSGVWPIGHVNECTTYGGCGFLDVCSAPGALRENILGAKFTEPAK